MKPIVKYYFGAEVRIERLAGGRAKGRVLRDGEVAYTTAEAGDVGAPLEEAWTWACRNRQIDLQIRDPERQVQLGVAPEYALVYKGQTIYRHPVRAIVEVADLAFRQLKREQWEREVEEHRRLCEALPGMTEELKAKIRDVAAAIAPLKDELKSLQQQLADLDPFKVEISDSTIADLAPLMARRLTGEQLAGVITEAATKAVAESIGEAVDVDAKATTGKRKRGDKSDPQRKAEMLAAALGKPPPDPDPINLPPKRRGAPRLVAPTTVEDPEEA